MRFWKKIFFGTLIIFIIAFDIGTYVLVSYSNDFNLKRETNSCLREQSVILSSLKSTIISLESNTENETLLKSLVTSYAAYYKDQGVTFALYQDDTKVYSNSPDIPQEVWAVKGSENKNIANQRLNGKRFLFVSSEISGYSQMKFVYVKDISGLDDFISNIGHIFVYVNAFICILLGISIYILLKFLTKPINDLNSTTKDITNGTYNKRVLFRRNDELGELATTFNIMADSVEEKVNQLSKSMQDKQMFIDNLAHEMKTPLTSILGYSEYLQNAMNNEEERIKAAGHLRNSAKRLQSLSSALLDLAYTREKIILKDIDTEHLFQALDDLMKHSLTERKLKLDITIHTPIICGDESLLLSLLSNLIENAARASIEGGIIKVSAYKKENLILEVSDVGFGMDENEILKITEPFYRVDKSRSRADGGIGLGMSICKQIAQLHNAELKIKSRPDIGTTVQLIFTSL